MKQIIGQTFDAERALYNSHELILKDCAFDGKADGESALKESSDITAENCLCNLRYPFWHNHRLTVKDTEMTENCRAALWYSDDILIENTKLHGIKALRECDNVTMRNCDIISPEFGWSVRNITMTDTTAESEYFMLRAENLNFNNVKFSGKYSFQYIENAVFEDCNFDTKDAFWHGKNITVKNSILKGEYTAWYSDGLTLENCEIYGTQPFCYCKNLRLVNCSMINTDLCFEKSEVNATITTPVISIKNPKSGKIYVPSVGELILDEEEAKGKVEVRN